MATPPSLLTFAPMIDSELSRLILTHYGLAYRERPHVFGWASILALWHGWTVQIPVLYGNGLRLAGPRGIVDHFDESRPAAQRLLPARQPLHGEIEADWSRFNGTLASDTAVLAYFHLLPARALMAPIFSRGIPAVEAALLKLGYPLLRGLFTLLLRLSAARASDALIRIREIVLAADHRLADGRPYLLGDAPTLADFALASALAPLLLPPGLRSPMPSLEAMPAAMQAIIRELRAHETARFVERFYARHASQGGGQGTAP